MAYCNSLAPQWQIPAERIEGLQLRSVIGNSFSDQRSRSHASDPKFSPQQGNISLRSVNGLPYCCYVDDGRRAGGSKRCGIGLQHCFKREASKRNPKSEYAQTMNAFIWNKLSCSSTMHLRLYSQLSFINTMK